MHLDRDYWEERYEQDRTGWDIGGPSTPLKTYLDQLDDKDLRILIPGGGRAYEAEYAHQLGFQNVFVIDLTDAPFKDLLERCPGFPKAHLIVGDFFTHEATYERILEQTFFCALDPSLRDRYVERMYELLAPGGKLVGVLFDDPLGDGPPFGGSKDEYTARFEKHFEHVELVPCYNSIKPRDGREVWLSAQRSDYVPIDCNLYDHYEEAATMKWTVHITLKNGERHSGKIVDLFIEAKVEWLRMVPDVRFRLDHITEMRVDRN